MEIGLYQPIDINVAHGHQPDGPCRDGEDVPLDVPGHQVQERDGEMAPGQEQAYRMPASDRAVMEKRGFFRNVGVPDEEKLAEGDIGPEHVVAEKQLARVVEVILAIDVL